MKVTRGNTPINKNGLPVLSYLIAVYPTFGTKIISVVFPMCHRPAD